MKTKDKIDTLQLNITRKCNLSCKHCHVSCNPNRSEDMSYDVARRALELLESYDFTTVDITGGAPEMSGVFKYLVNGASRLNKKVMIRSNLTIYNNENYNDIPEFLRENKVDIIASLPFYEKSKTDKMRGIGVFEDSIRVLKILNDLGYAKNPDLNLNLVYNPSGAMIPQSEAELEEVYRVKLLEEYGIVFNDLYAITNSPTGNFGKWLDKSNNLDRYMKRLYNSFNIDVIDDLMCRSTLSVDYDGRIYDCDFNLALKMGVMGKNKTIFDISKEDLENRMIVTANHCYSCTAGAGSS
ncbi:arsenosugar biosynthesis radical SAM (seleno)protein ArsS [uncultured Anaerococcus sp.]|uniref:arsenosugar biosynthesis radical SAM (seleno)protein ArsS n=1 Tax=uncultured Anaerococcus sp. TaxID=293428 RepID=UPI0034160621